LERRDPPTQRENCKRTGKKGGSVKEVTVSKKERRAGRFRGSKREILRH